MNQRLRSTMSVKFFRHPGTAALLLAAAACSPDVATIETGDLEFRGPPGSGEPNLFAVNDEKVILSWHEPLEGGGSALRMAVRTGTVWSRPTTIAGGRPFFVNWADFPSVVELAGGTLLAHWLEKTEDSPYAYHVMLSRSRDGGATWSDPVRPHGDMSPTEHGFVSIVPDPDGGAALLWLDGRAMAGEPGGDGHSTGDMSLRFTTVGAGGAIAGDVLVDDRTCECCQTAMVRTGDGALVAAYRDRSPEEIRDIAVVRFAGGDWSEPVHVGKDNWHYRACPVNGPALAASGAAVAIAWYSAPDENNRTAVAFSTDGGASFGDPIRVDDGDPLGRVDLELLDDGSALVVWLERAGTDAEIRGRHVLPSGRTGPSWTVTTTSQVRRSGFPRMARVGDELVFAWTDVEGGVRVATGAVRGGA